MNETNFPLGNIIIALVSSHRNLTTQRIRKLGLYPGQDMILMQLLQRDRQSQNELVQSLCVDHSTIAKSVNRLMKNDLVVTVKSEIDKRVTLVSLTSKGKDIAQQAQDVWDDVEKIATGDMSSEEVTSFLKLSEEMVRNFNNAMDKK
ncbi:MarR family winged helix-turn-helix transcriptional regulator [Companilactobacillus sp.]|jgi:DNA-binding MarR family transcriptional regulator|uniref:MarR family winged helix-turn-helix transcriptional regulator n=1 Tax=Companilactobacillus sp. TaxID=2767905 RepID=UPI0025BE7CDA|nr:MarR family winged helix-turn-helix transcriptional regulator [Companilactobacillus sp.]MCH4009408.1 MarR family winged helix-turn-helix transcriptional regulator [Companilactobacillus sp.]MCH4050413.1 MarR family winged helix-turn-helix transcriptional regulator [Companilactobacillus sp.]MCH4077350.1 MarR family winged helix-turn-helix transcriptional regulator [Companilactobacillus sp.]MCH4125926.1 MarR family winged helix-turn-helix transcriptional regulator [Companilactobacillus sp.]MCI